MATFTATSKTGQQHTKNSAKVVYPFARIYTYDGEEIATFHKTEKAALTGAHPHPSWANLPREVVATVAS